MFGMRTLYAFLYEGVERGTWMSRIKTKGERDQRIMKRSRGNTEV